MNAYTAAMEGGSLKLSVPASATADQHCDCLGYDPNADLGQVQVHALDVGRRGDDRGADGASRADRAEEMGRITAIFSHHWRTEPTVAQTSPSEPFCPPWPHSGIRPRPPDSPDTGQCLPQVVTEVF